MSAPFEDWCKAWLAQASAPVELAPPDFEVDLREPPAADRITLAVLLRFELLERFKACSTTQKRQQLHKRLQSITHWLTEAQRFHPLPARHSRPSAPPAPSKRAALNAVLQQHVLSPTPWMEPPWSESDSLSLYLVEVAEQFMKRLGPGLFQYRSFHLTAHRAVRAVAADYWRAGISEIHFGNDLAHAIEHFGGAVEIMLGETLNHFPVRWLPFLFEAALDERGARRYASAISGHFDIILTAANRKDTFALLRERQIYQLDDLMTYERAQRASLF